VHEGHELGMLLRKAYLSFHRRANSWMLDHGVSADQFVLLTVVAREPGITQISIVELDTGQTPGLLCTQTYDLAAVAEVHFQRAGSFVHRAVHAPRGPLPVPHP
jgi:hypothetical protein